MSIEQGGGRGRGRGQHKEPSNPPFLSHVGDPLTNSNAGHIVILATAQKRLITRRNQQERTN